MQLLHNTQVCNAYSTIKYPVGVTALRLHKKEKVSMCRAASSRVVGHGVDGLIRVKREHNYGEVRTFVVCVRA